MIVKSYLELCVLEETLIMGRAKEELRANQESLSLLFNSTAEGIFGLDRKVILLS